uniref:Leucine rich adaptor protein 1 n=1 Tax=Periophthalmus magnuspinnatus TaxID=409849 RepID=A0A3B4B2R4_9GOBI
MWLHPEHKHKIHLRSEIKSDVKILQQLLAVHEGIEAVKWLLEERSTLTSRCSSLTSSQYSLGEGPDTSWRGSWTSLQDPNDKLDNISIGSYLDTLADDMDEYCPSRRTLQKTKNSPVKLQSQLNKANGVLADKSGTATANTGATGVHTGSPRHSNQSPNHKPFPNGKIDTDDSCKLNGKNIHLEYDAHWRWVQSQEDVTFL